MIKIDFFYLHSLNIFFNTNQSVHIQVYMREASLWLVIKKKKKFREAKGSNLSVV